MQEKKPIVLHIQDGKYKIPVIDSPYACYTIEVAEQIFKHAPTAIVNCLDNKSEVIGEARNLAEAEALFLSI
jgi:hypothetical protein